MRWSLSIVLLVACGDDDLRVIAPRDAGQRIDAGAAARTDGGNRDGGFSSDAGRTDGGTASRDAGTPFPGRDGGGFPTFDGSFPTFDGSFPSFDASFPGGCMSAADCPSGQSCCAFGPVMVCVPLPMCP
jgi:hypothetical protein